MRFNPGRGRLGRGVGGGGYSGYSTQTAEEDDKVRREPELRFGGLLPTKTKYGGLGRFLVEAPLETLHSEFVSRGLMALHTDFASSQSDDVVCTMRCTLSRTGQTYVEYGIDISTVCEYIFILCVFDRLTCARKKQSTRPR